MNIKYIKELDILGQMLEYINSMMDPQYKKKESLIWKYYRINEHNTHSCNTHKHDGIPDSQF